MTELLLKASAASPRGRRPALVAQANRFRLAVDFRGRAPLSPNDVGLERDRRDYSEDLFFIKTRFFN
jgi:hypothetical protein